MRRWNSYFVAACFGLLSNASSQAELDPVKCQATVDSVVKLWESCSSVGISQRSGKTQSEKPSMKELRNCMDPQKLLALLSRLSMQLGYCLDFVVEEGGLGSSPVFYSRKTDAEPLDSFKSLINSLPVKESESARKRESALRDKHVLSSYGGLYCQERLLTDGSEEGFFQLTVFCLMGDEFLLQWHALYHDQRIICTKTGLDRVFAEVDSGATLFRKMESDARQKAYALDLKPTVRMDKKNVTVQVVVFTKWGGFQRRSFVFQRIAPHRLLDGAMKELVHYDCGLSF